MILIVSVRTKPTWRHASAKNIQDSKEEHSKIAEHVHRAGYHFRESIVEDARQKLGDRVISKVDLPPGFIEPIPATQDEMSAQAGNALLDLFPRIPNTDREMIIRHAFKKVSTGRLLLNLLTLIL